LFTSFQGKCTLPFYTVNDDNNKKIGAGNSKVCHSEVY
jgi:hypothetical protein